MKLDTNYCLAVPCRAARRWRARARAGLPDQARSGWSCPIRAGESVDATARLVGQLVVGGARPADRHRQPRRRGRHHRQRGGGEVRARRLHAAVGQRRPARHRAGPVQEARLRRGEGLRAGVAGRQPAVRAVRQPGAAGEFAWAKLVAYAKAHPGELNFGSTGVGSGLHLIGELFKSEAGIDIVHVPYKGVAQALPEMMAGKVQLAFNTIPAFLPHVKAGRLKALVITASARSPLLPEVPTTPEAGLPACRAHPGTRWWRPRARRASRRQAESDAGRDARRARAAQAALQPGRAAGGQHAGGTAPIHAGRSRRSGRA